MDKVNRNGHEWPDKKLDDVRDQLLGAIGIGHVCVIESRLAAIGKVHGPFPIGPNDVYIMHPDTIRYIKDIVDLANENHP